MTFRQLTAFVAVAQTLSFARACEQLHMSQPALSLAIKTLEESLGGRLLTRTTRQVKLTPEGAALLPQALRLISDWDNVREQLHERFTLRRGHLSIAATPSFAGNLLPALLRDYRARHANVEVSVHDVVNEHVAEMVKTGRVELGFAFDPPTDPVLCFEPLRTDRFVAIVPGDSPLAASRAISWVLLLQQPFIALQRPSLLRGLLEDAPQSTGMQLQVAFEVHQLATVGELVAAGLGVSVVPSYCRRQMEAMGAKCLHLQRPVVRKAVGMITRRDQELSTAALAMQAVARERAG